MKQRLGTGRSAEAASEAPGKADARTIDTPADGWASVTEFPPTEPDELHELFPSLREDRAA